SVNSMILTENAKVKSTIRFGLSFLIFVAFNFQIIKSANFQIISVL
ncbi:MAG: hypothetical protein ACJAZV_000731, partial [Roseivirga sp.]